MRQRAMRGYGLSRSATGLVAAVIGLGLAAVVVLAPTPYAIFAPGPTVDTLGDVNGTPLIQISGTQTYPTSGELRLTTVSNYGAPGTDLGITKVVREWLNPDSQVAPRDAVYSRDQTPDVRREQGQAQLSSSEQNATVAALEELGYQVTTTLTVGGLPDNSPSAGTIEQGDVLVALNGEAITSYPSLRAQLAEIPASTQVTVTVERDGTDLDETVVTGAGDPTGSSLGLSLQLDFAMPFEVNFAIEDIGGPSAGTMMALAIIDKLTDGDLTGGAIIAGTGTIDLAGNVGTIGGIEQKLAGAHRDGASLFLAPAGNCDGVIGHEHGMRVVPVETLHEARLAIEASVAGQGDSLPSCPAS